MSSATPIVPVVRPLSSRSGSTRVRNARPPNHTSVELPRPSSATLCAATWRQPSGEDATTSDSGRPIRSPDVRPRTPSAAPMAEVTIRSRSVVHKIAGS